MKKNINTGELVINYLATCGKEEVDTLELVKALMPGCCKEEDMDKAFGSILPVLNALESGGLVKLSTEAIPSTGSVPRMVRILPKMKQAADRLLHDQAGSQRKRCTGASGKKRCAAGRRQDAIDERYQLFVDLFEKKKNQLRIWGEWKRLISSMIYQDIEAEPGIDACVKSFVNGMVYRKRQEYLGSRPGPAGQAQEEEPVMRPELQKLIDDIVKAAEERNGSVRNSRKSRQAVQDADATLLRLDRDEIKDFMRCLRHMRDGVQPDRLWKDAMSKFMVELMQNLPVWEACMVSFKAGIAFQIYRKRLESLE